MMNYIETQHIVKDFASHRALDDVSISVKKGTIYGLLGPNGAGKTTLIRILTRIGICDEGLVFFDGRKMKQSDVYNIGYLPEERGLYRKMKVGEQAVYLARLKGLSKKDAETRLKSWFEKFDIMPWWNKKVEELSKGMQQKVQFVTTVLHEPDLLIFDEPFSGFDPVNAELLKKEILALKDKGHTIIFSTHNMQSVEEVCDEIGLINKSKLVFEGPVKEIKDRFKGESFRVSYRDLKEIPESLYEMFDLVKSYNDKTFCDEILLTNTKHLTTNEILKLFMPLGELVLFEEIIPSIQEIFIKTVTQGNPESSK